MSVGHQPPPPSASTWAEPPWSGWIESTGDALLILEAARRGLIPRVTRRLVDSERRMITSGSVFVFDEDESGIKRWTDGFLWSPSRILGNFLLYRETDKRSTNHRNVRMDQELMHQEAATTSVVPPGVLLDNQSLSRPKSDTSGLSVDKQRERTLMGSLTNSYKFKPDGLMKKTFSVTIQGVPQHLISYYKIADVESGRLRCPSTLPEFATLDISPEYLDKTHFRNPPKVEIGVDGIPRYRGESDDMEGGGPMTAGFGPSSLNLGLGPGDIATNMLGGPVLAPDGQIMQDHLGGAPGKRSTATRYDSYESVPEQKRTRKNTRSSEPPSAGGTSGSSSSTADHQHRVIHHTASPQPHQMSGSPHVPAPSPLPGGLVTYDGSNLQQQYHQQHQSLQQHLQAHQQAQLAGQSQFQTHAPQAPRPQLPPPPPQYLPFYNAGIPGYPPPPPPAAATYGQYPGPAPYGPAPVAYWTAPPPSATLSAASPMSTSSDSPSPSPMHMTHSHSRRHTPNPTSGLQNVAAVGDEGQSNTNNTTRNEPSGPRSDPSQNPAAGQLPHQEAPVLQQHHPTAPSPTSTTSASAGAQAAPSPPTTSAAGAQTPEHQVTPAPFYPYYAGPGPHQGHMPPPPPVMGSLAPQHRNHPQPLGPGMQPLQPIHMGMPPMHYGPPGGGYPWPPPPPPGFPGYPPPPPGPGGYGAYGQHYGVGMPGGPPGQVGAGAGPPGGQGQGQGPAQGPGAGTGSGQPGGQEGHPGGQEGHPGGQGQGSVSASPGEGGGGHPGGSGTTEA